MSHELGAVADDLDRVLVLRRGRSPSTARPAELAATGVSLGVHAHDLPLWLEGLGMMWPLPLPWPFEREYMQLALLAGRGRRRLAPRSSAPSSSRSGCRCMGDGIGHVAFAGVAAGLLLRTSGRSGRRWSRPSPAPCAVEWLRSRGRASGDLALALLFYSGIAGGVVLTGLAGSLDAGHPHLPVRLDPHREAVRCAGPSPRLGV